MYFKLNRSDRSGSIIVLLLYIYAFCSKNNINFEGLISDNMWWDNSKFFNEIYNYYGIKNNLNINKKNLKYIDFNLLIKNPNKYMNIKNCFSTFEVKNQCPYFTQNINFYFDNSFIKHLKTIIKKNIFTNKKLNKKIISIHIRRGDVNKTIHRRYTNDNVYIKVLKNIIKDIKDYEIHIFSENKFNGNINLFKKLKNTTLHLATGNGLTNFNKIFDDIFYMLYSDYLICSKSAFSYVSALLNENNVYFNNKFWCAPLDKFILYDDKNGNILN